MNAEFLVGVVIVITLWVFVILVSITPWFGITIIPYMVIFTFLGAVFIIGIIWAYKADCLEGVGWETLVVILFILAAVILGVFVLWYFIRKKMREMSKELKHFEKHHEKREEHHHHNEPFEEVIEHREYQLPPESKYSPERMTGMPFVPIPSLHEESISLN